MSERRSSRGKGDATSTRRGFVATLAAAVTASGLAGCIVPTDGAAGAETPPVSVLAAGSLQQAFSEGLRDAVSTPLRVEAHGSVTAARLVADGKRDPDVLAFADTTLFETVLDASWYAEFATNRLVVAYDDSAGGRRVRDAPRWFDPVLSGRATLGRTDPDLDPLGYRTLFALELGEDHYGAPDLRARLLDRSQIYPETSLLSRFESGNLDAAVVYRNMAEERGYDYHDLPAEIDLGDPARTDRYESASYELPNGSVVRGAPVVFGARARSRDDRIVAVYRSLLDGAYLADHGLSRPDSFPRDRGPVPDAFRSGR